MSKLGWEPSELAKRCQIHSAKMDEEGHYVTAGVLYEAANELSRLERLSATSTDHWESLHEFNPEFHPGINDTFIIAGTLPNGVKWSDVCHWDRRGWFSGHRGDYVEFWQHMPRHPFE